MTAEAPRRRGAVVAALSSLLRLVFVTVWLQRGRAGDAFGDAALLERLDCGELKTAMAAANR